MTRQLPGTLRVPIRSPIDWDLVRSRLRSSERALEAAMSESPERIDAVYRQRAASLAKGRSAHAPAGERLKVLVFRLGAERYAIEVAEVAEAIPLERCAPVPGSLPVFVGVINLRGELRAVVDLARLRALSGASNGDAGFVLVLRQQGQTIGFKVDRIEEFREIVRGKLSSLAEGKYVTGVAPGMLMLLSVDAVLEDISLKERDR
jgi:purine-binding chemotaxis protein CheW